MRPTARSVARVVRSSAPFAASAAALNVVPRLDAFFLLLLSSTSAAYVALGDRVLGPALFVPVILSVTLYPFVASHLDAHVNWKLVGIAGTLGALVALAGILLSPTLVPLVFGEKYRPAIVPVQVLLASLPFIYATNILLTYLYSAGRERRVLGVTLVAAVAGTIAVVCGQLVGGADLAAAGVLLRQALFTGALAAVGVATVGRVAAGARVGGARNRGRRRGRSVPSCMHDVADLVKRGGRRLGLEISHYRPFAARRAHRLETLAIETVIDVGANAGQYGQELRQHGYRGRIVSYEPLMEAFHLLEQTSAHGSEVGVPQPRAWCGATSSGS